MSIVDTPSIMMLLPPPPPSAAVVAVPATPGASEASCDEAAIGDRQVRDRRRSATVNERSPVCVWIGRRLRRVLPTSARGRRPQSSACRRLTRSPALTTMPDRFRVLKPLIATSTSVGAGRDVRKDEVAGVRSDDRRRLGALRLVDERDGGARNDPALCILHRPGHRAGRDLRAAGPAVDSTMAKARTRTRPRALIDASSSSRRTYEFNATETCEPPQ